MCWTEVVFNHTWNTFLWNCPDYTPKTTHEPRQDQPGAAVRQTRMPHGWTTEAHAPCSPVFFPQPHLERDPDSAFHWKFTRYIRVSGTRSPASREHSQPNRDCEKRPTQTTLFLSNKDGKEGGMGRGGGEGGSIDQNQNQILKLKLLKKQIHQSQLVHLSWILIWTKIV